MAGRRKATVTVTLEGKDGGNELQFVMDLTEDDVTEVTGNMELACAMDILADANARAVRQMHTEFHEAFHFGTED